MAQSLGQQLSSLNHQHLQYPSLLYTQQVSAQTDLDTIYHLGCKGMNKLTQIDHRFMKFQQSLFNVQSKGVSRQLQNKQQNQSLDNELRQCLLLMSQYWSFDGTHQAMEYLLRNFKLHEYLADELIVYFLIYHNTKIYVRLLQNVVDQQRNSMWGFCYEPISRGQTIPRDLLIRQIQLDYRILRKFLDYQCQLLQKESIQEEMVFTVQDFLYSEEEIQQIKLRQPNQLAFTYAILQDLKVSSGYMDQLRGTFGKLLALCIEENQDESRSFAYLIFNLQLFDSTRVLLTENQIANTASWVFTQVRNNDKLLDLCVLFYQFGIKSSYEQSLILLDFDLSKFYNNGLLLLEIIRQFKDSVIPDKLLNQLIVYLKHQLNKNDTYFIDSLITIIHEKLIPIVRPYLQDTQYKNLFPNYNDIQLTFTNSDKVLQSLNTNASVISIGTLTNLIEDSLEFFIKSKKVPFIHVLKQSLQISEQQFPQTVMFNQVKFYKLIDNLCEPTAEIHDDIIQIFMYIQKKQEDFNKIESLLLLSVHFPISVVNEIAKQLKIGKKAKSREDYIQIMDQSNSKLINQILANKVQKLKIFTQLKIKLAFVLHKDEQLINFINAYQWEDSFIKSIIESISTLQLLNLTNQYSIQYLKSINIDPDIFFQSGLNDLGSLKVLLHKSSRNLPFILKLFLIYDDLNVNQQEIFLQIVNEIKESLKNDIQIQEIRFSAELVQKTLKVFLKNRKEANFIKTVANLKDQDSVLDLQLLYLDNFEDLRVRQLKSLSNILEKTKTKIQKEKVQSLIQFIENSFTNEMLDSYLRILRFYIKVYKISPDFTFLKKIMFSLPIQQSKIINQYIDNKDVFTADVRTQMTIFVYSNSLPNKQVIVQEDLDFGMIINLLETPNLEIVSHLVELLRANVQHISEVTIKQCFKLKLESPTVIVLISTLIYDYLEYHKTDLLEECSQILRLILNKNYDLNVQINYAAVACCVKLIAKHTQINKAKKAFKALVYPNVEESGTQNTLLFYRIVTEQFSNHNPNFFNVSMFSFLITKILLILQNMDVNQDMLQNFSFFKPEQWWVILYILTITNQPKDLVLLFKSQVERFPYSVKLSLATALSESLFYRAQRHQKILKVKINQKLTQLQTPNLEASIKKIGTALRSQGKYIKIKLSLLRILELIENLSTNLKKYLLSSDLTDQQGDLLKSLIVHVSKFSNVFAHSKLKALSERIRSDIIHSLKIETLVPLIKNCISIRSVSNILLSAFTDILRLDAIKITKQQIPLLKDLAEQITNEISNPQTKTSSEMLLFLNYLYNVQIIQKQLLSQGQSILEILIEQLDNFKEQSSNQALILNLFGLITQQDTYPFLEKLNEIYALIIQLLSQEYNLILDKEFKYSEQICQISNKAILQAAATTIIKTFKGLISRQHLLQISVLFLMDPYNQGFEQILESIENRVHLDIYITSLVKQCLQLKPHVVANCLRNLAILVQKCESELVTENYLQLNKELLNVFDFSREQYIDSEMASGIFEADKLEDQINQVYLEIVLKINDIQFKKLYSNLILWSGKQLNQVGYNFLKYRRIQFFRLSNQISDKLGKYFTKYYAYIWDAIVNELHQFHSIFYETPKQTKLQKRTQDECDMFYRLELLLNKHVLQSISSLCQNDCETFVDTDKFEKLSEPLALTLDCPKVEKYEQILPFIEEWVTPTILALFQLLNDDYKWKDLHHKILMVISRHSNKKNEISSFISIGIVKLIHRLIDQLDERYLVLMNDLIPFLHQLTFSTLNSDELEKRVKQLIVRLSQLSGEDITTALK